MGRPITEMELSMRADRGARIERPEQVVKIPQLAKMVEAMLSFKREQQKKYEAKWEQKFAKMDQLIAAVQNIKPADQVDLAPLMKMMADIQKEHKKIAAEHAVLKAEYSKGEEYEDHEPCEYKLTGKRDRRGLIDLEHGLTFTPVK